MTSGDGTGFAWGSGMSSPHVHLELLSFVDAEPRPCARVARRVWLAGRVREIPAPVPAAPPGTVWVGPRHIQIEGESVAVAGFFLDEHPVTELEYQAFVVATSRVAPPHWLGSRVPRGREQHPVTQVTLADARAYAAWRSVRLPTRLEWLGALHGTNNQRFPWGDVCEPARCHCPRSGARDTQPVDARPESRTGEGARHLLGNVWEWVEDDEVLAAPEPGFAYAAGASFKHLCPARGEPLTSLPQTKASAYVGFRCARSVGR